ncbi:MAG: DUF6048 family protein [Bacteroidales bacterium]
MRKHRILHFTINLLLLCTVTGVTAQTRNTAKQAASAITMKADTAKQHRKLFNGIMVGVNIADPIMRAFGQKYGGYEGVVEANLLNRFFPEVSFGVGSAKTTADRGFHYEGKPAFYGRVGMNYNFKYKSDSPNFLIVGLRYGFSSYRANITNLTYENGYWDPSGPYDLLDQKFTSHWLEIGGGIRVKVFKNLYMGWMVYFKPLLKEGDTPTAVPWYIPGYGANGNSFGFCYNIYYRLPFFR